MGEVRGEIARPDGELFLNYLPFPFLLTSLITLNCDPTRCLGSLVSTTLDLLGRLVCSGCLGQKPLEIAAQINTALASCRASECTLLGHIQIHSVFLWQEVRRPTLGDIHSHTLSATVSVTLEVGVGWGGNVTPINFKTEENGASPWTWLTPHRALNSKHYLARALRANLCLELLV